MNFKLSKNRILKKNKQFQAVYRWGRSFANQYLVMYLLKQSKQNQGQLQIGFAAGKRLGNAVVRNRVKRLLREAYRLKQHEIPTGYSIIFVARKPVVSAVYSTVSKAMDDLLIRAKLK